MAQAKTSTYHTELSRKEKLFYTESSLHFGSRLFRIFRAFVSNEQDFRLVVKYMPIPEQRKQFFLERCNKITVEKWQLLFKFLLKYHTLTDTGEMLYEGFSKAGLTLQYLELANRKENYFLRPRWLNY